MTNRVSKIFRYLRDKLNPLLGFIKFLVIPQNKYLRATLFSVVFVSVFGSITVAYATGPDMMDQVIGLFNVMLFWIASGLGWVAMKVFGLIVWVSSYNSFVTSPAVTKGWVLVRDICNMFFVVILLVIAFAQILGVQKYSMKTLLPKVLIAAILVNFSKLICGLLIDMAQVVMMTFVNGYQATAGANLIQGLGLTKLLSLSNDATSGDGGAGPKASEIFVALLVACCVIFATIFVAFFIALLLLMRIVTLWILVVLSPAAFMLSTVPFGQGKANEWWQKFGWTVAVGPFMAFFLWLSLLIMSNPEEMMGGSTLAETEAALQKKGGGPSGEASYLGNIAQAAIGLAMLMASLMAAQEAGGAMGSLAQKGQKATAGALKKTAMRVSGAQSLADRGAAVGAGWKARSEAKKKVMTDKWQARGGAASDLKSKAVGAVKKTVASVGTLPIPLVKSIRKKQKDKKAAYQSAKASALAKGMTGEQASKAGKQAVEVLVKSEGGVIGAALKSGKDNWKNMGTGSTDMRMASAGKTERTEARRKAAEENLKRDGVETKEQKESLLNTTMSPIGEGADLQRAAIMSLAEKGELSEHHGEQGRKLFEKDPAGLKTFEESMKKKQANLAYSDLSDPKNVQKLADDIDSGDVDLTKLDASAYSDPKFMAAAHAGVGGKRFGADMQKSAKRSEKHNKIISESVGGEAFSKAVLTEVKAAKDQLTAVEALDESAHPDKAQRVADAQKKYKDKKGDIDKTSKTIASITGDLNTAFSVRKQNHDDTAAGFTENAAEVGQVHENVDSEGNKSAQIDTEALGKFISNSSAKTIAGLKIEPNANIQVAQSIQVNKMKSLLSSSEDGATENFDGIMTEIMKQAQGGNKEMQAKASNMMSIPDIKGALSTEVQEAIEKFNPPAPRSVATPAPASPASSSSSPLISTDTSQAAFDQARSTRGPNSWR